MFIAASIFITVLDVTALTLPNTTPEDVIEAIMPTITLSPA